MGRFLKICWLVSILTTTVCLKAGDKAGDAKENEIKSNQPEAAAPQAPVRFPLALLRDPSNLFGQLEQMNQLIQLTPEQLGQLRMTIEFLENMSPDERESMRARLAQIAEVSKIRKSEVRDLIPYLPPRYHSDLSQLWMAASDQQRAKILKAIEPLENWDKGQYLIARVNEFVAKRESVYAELIQSLEK